MQIDWCVAQLPIMAATFALFLVTILFILRSSERSVIATHAKYWGVDFKLAERVFAPARFRMSRALWWLWLLPATVVVILGTMPSGTPVFNTCPAPPFSWIFPGSATAAVCLLPALPGLMGLTVLLTPKAQAYQRRVTRIRRADLPDTPTEADFDAVLAQPFTQPWQTPVVAAIMTVASAAVLGWMWTTHIPQNVYAGRGITPPDLSKLGEPQISVIRVLLFGILAFVAWLALRGLYRWINARKIIAAKWSLTADETNALLAPASGAIYRSLTVACVIGALAYIAWMLWGIIMHPSNRSLLMAFWPGAAGFVGIGSYGLRLTFCARTTLHLQSLSRALSSLKPAAGTTAADIAAAIDRRGVPKGTWQVRLAGITIFLMSGLLLFQAAVYYSAH